MIIDHTYRLNCW